MRRVTVVLVIVLASVPALAWRQAPAIGPRTTAPAAFRIEEASIAQVQAAIGARRLTCHALVQQ